MHAVDEAVERAMRATGTGSRRGTDRAAGARTDEKFSPRPAELHFPLGGPRFRPCLEDVMEMLIDEFGVDHQQDAKAALLAGRKGTQLAAAVRDSPETVARVLVDELGYEVTPPEGNHPPDRDDKLTGL